MAMACSIILLFFFSFIPVNLALSIPPPNFLYNNCSDIGYYTSGSVYETNLNSLMSSLSSNTQIDYGFYNFWFGQEPDQVNAIALCRGDIALDVCRNCVNVSIFEIVQMCPYYMEAIIFHDECMLRYSNKSIFGVVDYEPSFSMTSALNVSNVNQFNEALEDLLQRLRSRASSGNSILKFASDDAPANFQEIYAIVQCTPDLSQQQCDECLVSATGDIPVSCNWKQGCRIVRPSCNFRFETNQFYTPDAVPPPPKKGKNLKFTIGIPIIIIFAFVILAILISMYFKPGCRNQKVVIATLAAFLTIEAILLAVVFS